MKPHVTAEAKTDLFEIWDYIASRSGVAAADRVSDTIEAEIHKIGETPGAGHFREDVTDNSLRFWGVYSYLIAYRWQPRPVEIVAIVHGARDLRVFFEEREH